ncbi:type IV pilus twitching motility protein PilT [Desulforamulus ruminis]|uniref:Twitching motility protein n=1 Tax=Desulforamulus ruminis (strain ATCC 23193 / DSM 2154 / NCIMB 8452 / DL) TaxID=696281 RepID=F6DRJ6_DESRL|nr:type IV pilus twitching motility protein PilT [Desulforamulus ruminis]AEG58750.1 twitching motility protein [Desulforamulus ruminis DSM 2154]
MTQQCPAMGNRPVFHLEELLQRARKLDSSDLHLTADMPPVMRINGRLQSLEEYKRLSAADIKRLLYDILTPRQIEVLEKRLSVDLAISFSSSGRFRVNAYYQRGAITSVLRRLSDDIPQLEELNLPSSVFSLPDLKNGLVLVTGTTGSGKSTTLAAIIDRINHKYSHNIITIEDPIEYVHYNHRSIINQRELHTDVDSFADALRSALRADPDVILVGEMRDLETIRAAIMAAETGHLVFSTLHSRDVVSSINRMVGVFPTDEQTRISQQLSLSLKAVLSQQLLPRANGKGRVLATEVMPVTPAISNLIRLSKQEHIYMSIETGRKLGMQTMDQCLEELYKAALIDGHTAVKAANNPLLMQQKLGLR